MPLKPNDTFASNGHTYYIDAETGNDTYEGISAPRPWKSFKNLEQLKLRAGDQLLLKRGSRFHEVLRISGQGKKENIIRVDAYGKGNKPQVRF